MSPTTIIIDLDKSIILEHIGDYSEQLEESIFHIFIPYNNLCIDPSNSNVCGYIQPTNPNMVEVDTIISDTDQMFTVNDKRNVSIIIQEDTQRVLLYHRVDRFIEKTKSVKTITPTFSINTNQRTLVYRSTNPAALVLEEVFNNKVGYDFLIEEQITELLSLTISTADRSSYTRTVTENINIFTNLIVVQSVYALRSCSLQQSGNSRDSHPCLVVSTVFRQIPIKSSLIYQVYRSIPLPMPYKGEKYVYADLPKIFDFDYIHKKIVLWNEDKLSSTCVFSKIVQCRNYPVNAPLSSVPCVDELLGSHSFTSSSNCQVTKSKDNLVSVLNIKDNIWYLYAAKQSFDCESLSLSSPPADPISVHCANSLLPPIRCANITVVIKSQYNSEMEKRSVAVLLFKNVTDRVVSIYKIPRKTH